MVCHGQASAIFASLEPEYQRELNAMASAAECDPGSLAYGNCFLDLGDASAGCRSVITVTEDGLLHSHNLDWNNLAGLARWTTLVTRRNPDDGRYRTVSIGFPV